MSEGGREGERRRGEAEGTHLLGLTGAVGGRLAHRDEFIANSVTADRQLEREHIGGGVVGAGVVLHGGDVEGNADSHGSNEGDEHLEVKVDAETEVSDLVDGGFPDWKGRIEKHRGGCRG